ncbi:MAG: hypothetical protein R3D86_11920 [Emcibacteraceae bacterium]
MDLQIIVDGLEEKGIEFEVGLTENEFAAIEKIHRFSFPPDLKCLLAYALPVSEGFADWRRVTDEEIRNWLEWPLEGVMREVKRSGYWIEEWGDTPIDQEEVIDAVRIMLSNAPKLIPIYGHRYMPTLPVKAGNPVYSVMQTDIIEYGSNLWSYLGNDFGVRLGSDKDWYSIPGNKIEFWDDIVFNN